MIEIVDLILPDIISVFIGLVVIMIIYNLAATIFGWTPLTFSTLKELFFQ